MPSSSIDHTGCGSVGQAAAAQGSSSLSRPVVCPRPGCPPRPHGRSRVVMQSQRFQSPFEGGVGQATRSLFTPWATGAASQAPAGIAAAAQAMQSSKTVQDATPASPSALSEILQLGLMEDSQPAQPVRDLPSVTVRFVVPEFVSAPGQQLIIVGSVGALGSWDLTQGVPMTWQEGHRWTAEVQLDPGWHGALEFKVVLRDKKAYVWEPGGNRLLVVERPKLAKRSSSSSNLSQHTGRNSASNLIQEEEQASTTGAPPVLCVECEWGKAEPPSTQLPPSLLCAASTPGMLANGMPLHSEQKDALGEASVVMANCQVVIPTLDHTGLSTVAAADSAGALAQDPSVKLVLVGSVPALGCWDPAQGLQLARDESGMWRARMEIPMGYAVHAKLVFWDTEGKKVKMWEPGNNRIIRLPEPPASLLQPHTPALSRSPSTSGVMGSPGGARSAESGSSSGSHTSSAGGCSSLYPVMPGGTFMWLLHWSLPAFPHLLFLPALDDTPTSVSGTTQAGGAGAGSAAAQRALKPSSSASSSSRPVQTCVQCKFTLPHYPTQPNQHLLLVGSTPQLGEWDPTRGLRLQWGPGHSWKATTQLPADKEIQAKVVLWDGSAYRWEGGANRKLHPGQLVRQATASGMGEVLHILYWAGKNHDGRTPAVVIPHDEMLASSTILAPQRRGADAQGLTRVTSLSGAEPAATSSSSAGRSQQQEPSLALIQLMSFIAGLAIQHGIQTGNGSGINLEALAGDSAAPGKAASSAFSRLASANAGQLATLEATLEALKQQLAEAQAGRQRESDALRQQLAESSKALAAEEDQVESLHAALAGRTAEIRNLQQQLACAEATAAAAIAAATTALSSASLVSGGDMSNGHTSNGHDAQNGSGPGGMNRVAVATFQKLTEQLAVLQLEVDQARHALTEATAAKTAEVAHLRAELSEAVAYRHRDAEAARVAAAAAALTHQQEVSALQNMLADMQSAKERESAALQARMEAVATASASETARLARQLAQACAAAEALERQLIQQCSNTAALSASGGAEVRRLKGLLNNQASELETLRNQLADGHAAQALGQFTWGWGGQHSNGNGNGNPGSNGHGKAGSNGHKKAQDEVPDVVGNNHVGGDNKQVLEGLPSSLVGVMSDLRAVKQELVQLSGRPYTSDVSPGPDAAAATGSSPQPGAAAAAHSVPQAVGGGVGTGRLVHVTGRESSRQVKMRPVIAAGPMASWIQRLSKKQHTTSASIATATASSKSPAAARGTSHLNNIVSSAHMPGSSPSSSSDGDALPGAGDGPV